MHCNFSCSSVTTSSTRLICLRRLECSTDLKSEPPRPAKSTTTVILLTCISCTAPLACSPLSMRLHLMTDNFRVTFQPCASSIEDLSSTMPPRDPGSNRSATKYPRWRPPVSFLSTSTCLAVETIADQNQPQTAEILELFQAHATLAQTSPRLRAKESITTRYGAK